MEATEQTAAKSLKQGRARPDRIRVALWDRHSGAALDLPARRTWPAGLALAAMFALFAGIAWTSVFRMRAVEVRGLFDLMFVLFEGFWVLGWMAGVAILGLLAVLFLFYGESARVEGRKLVHVARLGPLKILGEYELGRIRNVRLEDAKARGQSRVRFDYGGRRGRLGDAMPVADAQRLADALRRAAGSVPAVPEPAAPAAGMIAEAGPPAAPAAPLPPTSASSLALIAANLFPLAGVLALGWDAAQLMVLFWAESAIIGFYTALRIIVVARIGALFALPFFVGHFGAFMAAHFMLVYGFFVRGPAAAGPEPGAREALLGIFAPLWPALAALAVSHGVSFASNFLGRREYVGASVPAVTTAPYRRIILMQVTIILGGWIVLLLDSPAPALALLVLLKIAMDLPAHRKEHANARMKAEG